MGGEHAVSVLHRPRRRASSQGCHQRTPSRIQSLRLAADIGPGSAVARDLSSGRCCSGTRCIKGSTRACSPGIGDLIKLRRSRVSDADAEPATTNAWYDTHAQPVAVLATSELLVGCNLGDAPVPVPEASGRKLLLSSDDAVCTDATPSLDADEVAIWSVATARPLKQRSAGGDRLRIHNGSVQTNDAPPPGVDSAVISPPWSRASSRER